MLTVDGLALRKASAKEEAVAMTTKNTTWAPSTAFIQRVSTPLHDPGGGYTSVLFSNLIMNFATVHICEEEGLLAGGLNSILSELVSTRFHWKFLFKQVCFQALLC